MNDSVYRGKVKRKLLRTVFDEIISELAHDKTPIPKIRPEPTHRLNREAKHHIQVAIFSLFKQRPLQYPFSMEDLKALFASEFANYGMCSRVYSYYI